MLSILYKFLSSYEVWNPYYTRFGIKRSGARLSSLGEDNRIISFQCSNSILLKTLKNFWVFRTLSFLILPLIIKREYYSEKGGHLFRVSHFVIQNIFLIFSAQCLYANVFKKFPVLSLMVLRTSYHSKLVTLITILETNLPKFLFKSFYCKYLVVFKLKQLTITLNIFKVVNVVIKVTYLNCLPIYHHHF